MKLALRMIGVLFGLGVIFIGLMPHLGMITDWQTVPEATRLIASALSGLIIGVKLVVVAFCSGLVSWIFDQF